MAVVELSEPTADVVQKNNYNANVGGELNKRIEATAQPTQAWAVLGAALDAGTTPAQVETSIVPAIAALPQVTDVVGDQAYGQGPNQILPAAHQCNLHITSRIGGPVSSGTGEPDFSRAVRGHSIFKVSVDRLWAVFILIVPDVLNTGEIDALQAAVDTVAGITKSRHITDGAIPDRQQADSPVYVDCHMRIEPIEA